MLNEPCPPTFSLPNFATHTTPRLLDLEVVCWGAPPAGPAQGKRTSSRSLDPDLDLDTLPLTWVWEGHAFHAALSLTGSRSPSIHIVHLSLPRLLAPCSPGTTRWPLSVAGDPAGSSGAVKGHGVVSHQPSAVQPALDCHHSPTRGSTPLCRYSVLEVDLHGLGERVGEQPTEGVARAGQATSKEQRLLRPVPLPLSPCYRELATIRQVLTPAARPWLLPLLRVRRGSTRDRVGV